MTCTATRKTSTPTSNGRHHNCSSPELAQVRHHGFSVMLTWADEMLVLRRSTAQTGRQWAWCVAPRKCSAEMATPELIKAAIEAHGGQARWDRVDALEATLSAGGFLFTAKHRPVLRRIRVRASAREVRFAFHDFPRAGETSELVGDEVRVVGPDRAVLARREHPRLAFSRPRRQLYWDHLDFVYFGAYATWNYLVTPFLFLREGFAFEELPPLQTPAGPWSRVRVTFPADLPTHSCTQDFYFDAHHLLRRLDYTADVVGGWAHAAHMCEQMREFDGLQVATRRTVKPLPFGTNPLPLPTLVAIELHDLRVCPCP